MLKTQYYDPPCHYSSPSKTAMSSENPFISPLGKLALSLGASSESSSPPSDIIPPQLSQRRKICIVTLLRIIDNILDDPDQLNPKLRKIKVSNPAFHKRCGQWDGSIDYLLQCGFCMKGNQTSNSSRHLRLDEDDRDMLLYGRDMLVQFAVLTLGVDEKTLPKSPKQIDHSREESHTDDDAKLVHATVKSNGMHSETVGSAPTVDENASSHKLSRTAQIEAIGEHSVSNVVSEKTDGVAAASHQDEQAIESPRIETQAAAHTSLPVAAAKSPLTDIQTVKEVEKPLRTQNEERTAFENGVISADEMMTNLLDEIEAELNDDFFSTAAEESTTAQEALVSMNSDTKIASENSIGASPKDESISVRSSESISNIEEGEESDDLAMAIAMSLSAPDSGRDENEEKHIEDDGDRSNNKSLPQYEEDVTASSQQSDLKTPPTLERTVAQPLDTAKTVLNGASSLAEQENGIHGMGAKSPLITSEEPNAHDKEDDSCKGNDESEGHHHHVASVQSDSESNKSTPGGTAHKDSRLSEHMNDRTSTLRTSMSSVKTLQIRNTSVQPQDGNNEAASAVKEDAPTTKVDRPQAAAGGHISQSHDVQSDYTRIF
eukprot:scaffold11714_cov123-Skeletonema_marinoi.AAC.9